MSWWQKWLAFFRPVPDWRKRYRQFLSGQRTWEIPGKPEKSKCVPYPLQWIPHTFDESQFDEADAERGFKFLDAVCCDTGRASPIGVGVLCLRCGVPLHPEAANMYAGFDPPYCKRCHFVIRWV